MQKSNRYEHPHKAIITDAIKEIKKFQKEGHEIILSIDGNEVFTNEKGGIAKMFKECKLYDPFSHRHNDQQNLKSYIRGSDKIDFLFCTYNILKAVPLCGMTAFNEITVLDHCGLFIDVKKDIVLKDKIIEVISPFSRKLQSNYPKVIRHYKKQL